MHRTFVPEVLWTLLNFDNVQILDRESDWFTRGVKEAIYTRTLKPSLNKREPIPTPNRLAQFDEVAHVQSTSDKTKCPN